MIIKVFYTFVGANINKNVYILYIDEKTNFSLGVDSNPLFCRGNTVRCCDDHFCDFV